MTPNNGLAGGLKRATVLQGVLPIDRSRVPKDIIAGLTLAALAIPEVMGYTKIAGTPVVTGLYTMLVPMILFAVFGSSRHLVVGADSATAAILAAGLVGMAARGSSEYVALAGVLALLAAAFLFVARLVRLGFLADFLSRTVLTGFLTGVGIQVALGQVQGMLGIPSAGHGSIDAVRHLAANIDHTHVETALLAGLVLAAIFGARRLSERIPGPLIAVIAATFASWAFGLEMRGIEVLGPVPSGLPSFAVPNVDWSWSAISPLLPTAFSIFIVILAQSAATSRAYAARYNERFNENVDLVGLGLANLGAAFSGTFVVNGSPTKTQMVDGAGGRSQVAHLTTVLVVVLILLFLTAPLRYMPSAALSAIVFVIGVNLIDIRGMRMIYMQARSEFWVALVTAVLVVVVGVEQGVVVAMVLSLLEHTRRGYRPTNTVIAAPDEGVWRAVPVSRASQFLPGLLVYRFNHSMYYANAERLSEEVLALVEEADPPLAWFCIDMAAVDSVDFSAAQTLRSLHGVLRERAVRLVIAEASDGVRAEFDRYGLTALIGAESIFATGRNLVDAYRQRPDKVET